MKDTRDILVRHLREGVSVANKTGSDYVSIKKSDAIKIIAFIDGCVMPGTHELSKEEKEWLDKISFEKRIQIILDIIFDWDGYQTADELGRLLNEVYAYLSYPCKEDE